MSSRKRQRICAKCGIGIAETRPPFLVAEKSGKLYGPYHAGCAEKIRLERKRHKNDAIMAQADLFGEWQSRAAEEHAE